MGKFFAGMAASLAVAIVAGGLALSAGLIDVAADTPHSAAVSRMIAWGREYSIARGAAAINPPADLAHPERVRRGAGNYAAMCVSCHLSPAEKDSELRRGLYPQPPDLARDTDGQRSAARQFWIIKHGIKASGMPSWSKAGMEDAAIWDVVAFLHSLPYLTVETYRQQVAASDGHSHAGSHSANPGKEDPAGVRRHIHGNHKH